MCGIEGCHRKVEAEVYANNLIPDCNGDRLIPLGGAMYVCKKHERDALTKLTKYHVKPGDKFCHVEWNKQGKDGKWRQERLGKKMFLLKHWIRQVLTVLDSSSQPS